MRVLFLLPCGDYDPTESGVPWKAMVDAGHQVVFATPDGQPGHADPRLVDLGFSLLSPFLMTRQRDIATYQNMAKSSEFLAPITYAAALAQLHHNAPDQQAFDALFIPGGHAPNMKTMIDSADAQAIARWFFQQDKPRAAVCHGVLTLARSRDEKGQSVLQGCHTTALPASMELSAWAVTFPWLKHYYRTYPTTVESEVREAVGDSGRFDVGPFLPLRDRPGKHRFGFTVRDGFYLSARWPGDCNKLAADWLQLLADYQSA